MVRAGMPASLILTLLSASPQALAAAPDSPSATHAIDKVQQARRDAGKLAAEDFLVSFDALKRGIMVGEASGGSTDKPMSFPLPGGQARICVKDDRLFDRRKFVGIGIAPQIVARETVADFRAGKDDVVEAAVEQLSRR